MLSQREEAVGASLGDGRSEGRRAIFRKEGRQRSVDFGVFRVKEQRGDFYPESGGTAIYSPRGTCLGAFCFDIIFLKDI